MIYLSKGGAGADSDHTWIRPCTYQSIPWFNKDYPLFCQLLNNSFDTSWFKTYWNSIDQIKMPLIILHQFSKWSCVVWWDVFALQTAKFMICPPFYLELMYLENCNSHTGKSIHFWKDQDISKLTMHISIHYTGWPRSYTGWYNKIPDKIVCQLNKADYLLATGTWMLNIYFDKRQGKLTKIGETICSCSVISEYRVFQNRF